MNDMGAQSLGIANLDVTSVKGASDAINALDNAIETVSSERSRYGAYRGPTWRNSSGSTSAQSDKKAGTGTAPTCC